MKDTDFLTKIKKEKKLSLVEPSDEIKSSYIVKSESNLISAKLLFKNCRLEESVSLAYYSMYNILIALFFRVGVKSENHSATIILLKEIFDIDNSFLAFAKKERIDKQYYVDFHISEIEVKDFIKQTEDFNVKIFDFISKLTNERVKLYRNKFINLLKLD